MGAMIHNAPQLLRVDRAAEIADCHRSTILRLVRRGDLEAVRLSKRALRVREDSLCRWLEARRLTHEGDAA